MRVTSERPAAEIELAPTEEEMCGVETNTFTDKQVRARLVPLVSARSQVEMWSGAL